MDNDKLYEIISAILATCVVAKSKDDNFSTYAIDGIGKLITNSIDMKILESHLDKFDTGAKLAKYLNENLGK